MSGVGRGYIHIYTGEGKGKTTASLGLALRASGRGLRVLVIQFLKGPDHYTGESTAAQKLPNLVIRPGGAGGFVYPGRISEKARRAAVESMRQAVAEVNSGSWDLVVLDEVNVAVSLGLVPLESVLGLMESKPDGVELVLTGRDADPQLVEKADLVTEMREVRHYYHEGVAAREGIEK